MGQVIAVSAQAKQIVRPAEFRLTADEILEIEKYLRANPVAA
jgi:hypothetical protein